MSEKRYAYSVPVGGNLIGRGRCEHLGIGVCKTWTGGLAPFAPICHPAISLNPL